MLGLATVIGHLDQTERRLRLATVPAGEEIWAEMALAADPDLSPGARVLVAKDGGMRHYVIGVLGAVEAASQSNARVVARDGSSALRVVDGEDERLQIQDRQGRLLFEYRPQSGTAVVSVPEGDLQIRAPGGNIDLVSGRALRLSAVGPLSMTSVRDLSLTAGGGRRGEGSTLRLAPDDAALTAERLSLRAALGDMVIGRARYRGEQFDANVSRAKLVLGKLECLAERVVTQARSLYQRVEHLHHTSAGRVRTLVQGTFDVRSRRLRLKCTEIAKIDGREIHFG
jgi:hypothetical protein